MSGRGYNGAISTTISTEHDAKVEKMSKLYGWTKKETIENCIEKAYKSLDDSQTCNECGKSFIGVSKKHICNECKFKN